MGNAVRISVIGGGSATFSLGLIKDICLTESLNGSEISFMDIDPERLEISTDCGLRRVPRYLAISKLSAAAEAARRLRQTG